MHPVFGSETQAGRASVELALLRLTLIVVVVSMAGCSFIFSRGPSNQYDEMGEIDCSGYTAPVLDTIWAGLNGLGALQAAAMDDASWQKQYPNYDRSTVIGSGLLWLAISGMSAAYGYRNGSACLQAKEEMISGERRRHRRSRRERILEPENRAPMVPPSAAPQPPPSPAPAPSPEPAPTDATPTGDDPFAAP